MDHTNYIFCVTEKSYMPEARVEVRVVAMGYAHCSNNISILSLITMGVQNHIHSTWPFKSRIHTAFKESIDILFLIPMRIKHNACSLTSSIWNYNITCLNRILFAETEQYSLQNTLCWLQFGH